REGPGERGCDADSGAEQPGHHREQRRRDDGGLDRSRNRPRYQLAYGRERDGVELRRRHVSLDARCRNGVDLRHVPDGTHARSTITWSRPPSEGWGKPPDRGRSVLVRVDHDGTRHPHGVVGVAPPRPDPWASGGEQQPSTAKLLTELGLHQPVTDIR